MNETSPLCTAGENIGTPLAVLIVMSCLATIGIVFSVLLIVFNIAYRKHKLMKMTSPNINVVILLGTMMGYTAMVVGGLDSNLVGTVATSSALQACTFLTTIGFTIVYGGLFVKVSRIYMIFNSLSFNGKTFRDEQLLLVILLLAILDLAILVPWQATDPVTCVTWHINAIEINSDVNATNNCAVVDSCSSNMQSVWISVVYVYKAAILTIGLYLTWNTRQVTLPALKDATTIAVMTLCVSTLALMALPELLTANKNAPTTSASSVASYTVCCLAEWFAHIVTVCLLFIPKVQLVRKYDKEMKNPTNAAGGGVDDTRLHFNESMKTTKSSSLCCCWPECIDSANKSGDDNQYAVDVLSTEIRTLKQTIKEKDVIIRELTDRLYIGAERFQLYLASTRQDQTMTSPQRSWSNTVYPVGNANGDVVRHNSVQYDNVQQLHNSGDEFDSSSDDDDNIDDDDANRPSQQQQIPSVPQQLNVSTLLNGTGCCNRSENSRQTDDGSYDAPSLADSGCCTNGGRTELITDRRNGGVGVGGSRSTVAVIHCKPVTVTADDFDLRRRDRDQQVPATGASSRSVGKQVKVYQI